MKESEIRPEKLFNEYLELAAQDARQLLENASDFTDVVCPACARPGVSEHFTKLGFRYCLCATCRSLYVSPRPSPQLLHAFYANARSVQFWSEHFYRETYEARKEKMFRPRAMLIPDLWKRYGSSPAPYLADVGSGYGMFLEELWNLNFCKAVIGIEPNGPLAKVSRNKGFNILESRLEDLLPGQVQADLATGFEILEHVFDPLQFVAAMRDLVQPGGILYMTTLTVSGFDIQVLWENSKSIYPPHHLNLMSIAGIEKLMKRADLEVLEICTPGRLDVDIVLNALKANPSIPIQRFVSQLLFESDERARNEFQEFLKNNRLSSHVQIIARVPA